MARNNVLRWKDGRGWLVLSGDASTDIRAQALGRVSADGGVAYLGEHSEETLDDMVDLGAPAGYVVDVMAEDDETIQATVADAGLVVIGGYSSAREVRSGLLGAAAKGMEAAFGNGAIILAEGQAAAVFGRWVATEADALLSGLNWLENGLILPDVTSLAESVAARVALGREASAIVISIGSESALALGPDGEVETWGARQVAIALGSNYGGG
jgi:hypothetical protein